MIRYNMDPQNIFTHAHIQKLIVGARDKKGGTGVAHFNWSDQNLC